MRHENTEHDQTTTTDTDLTVGTSLAFHSPAFTDTGVPADTTTKAEHVAPLVDEQDGWELVAPEPVGPGDLLTVHDLEYVDALISGDPLWLAQSNGIGWDERLLTAVLASTGGVLAAVVRSLEHGETTASLSSGLHHARPGSGEGYCTVNGLAIAVRAALELGATRVLVLDLDAHCGGGTVDCLDGVRGFEQVDVSVNSFDHYASTSTTELVVSTPEDYLEDVERALGRIDRPGSIDVVLYNAGMDPHEDAGGLPGITTATIERREQLVFDWAAAAGVPVAFTLAGGYRTSRLDLDGVAELHLLTFLAASRAAGRRVG